MQRPVCRLSTCLLSSVVCRISKFTTSIKNISEICDGLAVKMVNCQQRGSRFNSWLLFKVSAAAVGVLHVWPGLQIQAGVLL